MSAGASRRLLRVFADQPSPRRDADPAQEALSLATVPAENCRFIARERLWQPFLAAGFWRLPDTLVDGRVLDSSYPRGQPAEFPVGGVIAAGSKPCN